MIEEYRKGLAEECENRIFTIPEYSNGEFHLDKHQEDAMVEICEALLRGEGAFSIVHSCGSGKTILEANMLLASLKVKEQLSMQDCVPDILLTTERTLIHSIYEELKEFGLDVGIWGAGKKILDRPIVLSTIQSLQRNNKDLDKQLPLDRVPLIIGDEADLYLTEQRKSVLGKYNNALKLGFTATDTWPDGRDIVDVWGRKIHHMPLKEGILNGVNVPPMFSLFEAQLDDSELKITQGDYDKKSLSRALQEAEIQKAITEAYRMMIPQEKRKDFPTLVYVPSVALVHKTVEDFQKKFQGQNLSVRGWTGESTTNDQLKDDIESFNSGEVDILVACEMGGRGMNLPRARALIDGYPTLSANKLEQRHGRVLRKVREGSSLEQEGFKKDFAMIAQIIPKSRKYRPYLLPDLLDCWDDFREGKLLLQRDSHDFHGKTEEMGASIQNDVQLMKKFLEGQNPSIFVNLVDKINVYEQLKIREDLPQADENGFFKKDGKEYGHIPTWADAFTLNASNVGLKLRNFPSIQGKTFDGRITSFYSEDNVLEALGELITKESPLKEGENITVIDGKRIASRDVWAKEFHIGKTTMLRRIPKGTLTEYRGRTGGDLFTEDFVKEKLKDLIVEKDVIVDENGCCEKDGLIYKITSILADDLGVSVPALRPRIKNIKTIKGKDRSGHIRDLYPEKLVIEACSDLIDDLLPNGDKNGFFLDETGEKYGTIIAWARELKIGKTTIRRKLNKCLVAIETKKGKTYGHLFDFYAESFVKEICSDTLKRK